MPRAPLSEEAHKLNGTYRPGKHGGRGTSLDCVTEVECPNTLGKDASQLWEAVVPSLCSAGLLTIPCTPVLENAFHEWEVSRKYRNISSFLESSLPQGKFDEGDEERRGGEGGGGFSSVFEYMIKADREASFHATEFSKIMYKFGASPQDALKIRGTGSTKTSEVDAVQKIIGQG